MKLPWVNIESCEHLEEVLASSSETYKLFFKHSTRCIISSMALKMFESEWNIEDNNAELFFIDLIQFRDVSNKISQLLHVEHQSPQVIVVKNNQVVYHASHNSIDANRINKLIKNV